MTASGTPKLSKFLGKSGFVFRVAFSADCQATIQITVGAADAKRLKLGGGATTLVRTGTAVTAGEFAATLKPAAKYRAKLERASRVPALVLLSCNDGTTTATAQKKVTFSG
jgi:hypothetical protein